MEEHDFRTETASLLRELQSGDEPDTFVLGRVRQRLAVSLTAATIALSEPARSLARAGGLPRDGWFVGSKPALAAMLVLGTALGATGYALLRPSKERIVYRDRVVASPAASVTSSAASSPPVASTAASLPLVDRSAGVAPYGTASSQPRAVSTVEVQSLAAELRLVDRARNALAAGEPSAALGALEAHAKQYRHGTLEQEREALWVRALVGVGRFAEARDRGRRFAERYPRSTLLDSVNGALRTIP